MNFNQEAPKLRRLITIYFFMLLAIPYLIWGLDSLMQAIGFPCIFPLSVSESIMYVEAAISVAWAIYIFVRQSQYQYKKDQHEDYMEGVRELHNAKRRIGTDISRSAKGEDR